MRNLVRGIIRLAPTAAADGAATRVAEAETKRALIALAGDALCIGAQARGSVNRSNGLPTGGRYGQPLGHLLQALPEPETWSRCVGCGRTYPYGGSALKCCGTAILALPGDPALLSEARATAEAEAECERALTSLAGDDPDVIRTDVDLRIHLQGLHRRTVR